jgi:hypothetical protein
MVEDISMQQQLPRKPSYLSDDEWQFILARDAHRCANYERCVAAGSSEPCSATCDIDHFHPQELGGDDSFANVRLLCSGPNRGRKLESSPKWAAVNFWDQTIAVNQLRLIQQIAGWDEIDILSDAIRNFEAKIEAGPYGERPGNFRRALLGNVTLLPGVTGIGKAILTQSILFKMNEIIGLNRPRVCRVLWLTIDRTLRDLGRTEIEQEAYEYNIVQKKPSVGVAQGFDDLSRGPMGADVIMSAVQSLWRVEENNELRRSDDEMRKALIHFDTLIFDECDWGDAQVQRISRLANHAMQFALTASPPIFENEKLDEVLKRFVLISTEAIADYKRAQDNDGCLKLFGDRPIMAAEHGRFDIFKKGDRNTVEGKSNPDHVLNQSAVLQAITEADDLETKMRIAQSDDWYSPHIMVRMASIAEVKTMLADLQPAIEELYARGVLKNPGWNVTAIFQGHEKFVSVDERDLSAKTRKNLWRHPFMLAKNNKGQASKDSKRVLLMCNIGVRGINNWTIQSIVDCTGSLSTTELIQFVFGRPIRLPQHLASWLTKEKLKQFVTALIYIPSSKKSIVESKEKAIAQSKDFVQNMLERIVSAGFRTWQDLIDGIENDTSPDLTISTPIISRSEKYQIQGALADRLEDDGSINPEDIAAIVGRLFPDSNRNFLRKAESYASKIVSDPDFAERETTCISLDQYYANEPVDVTIKLHPQDQYDIEELRRHVKNNAFYKDLWQTYLDELNDGRLTAIHSVSDHLRSIQVLNYREPIRVRKLWGSAKNGGEKGVINELAGELGRDLELAGQIQLPQQLGIINKAIAGVAKTMFGLESASADGPMDHPAYHNAMTARYRRDIQAMARGRLIRDGEIARLKRLVMK